MAMVVSQQLLDELGVYASSRARAWRKYVGDHGSVSAVTPYALRSFLACQLMCRGVKCRGAWVDHALLEI